MLADGSQLGPYKIIARIGAGGMGEVYRAIDTDGREFAIKIISELFAQDAMMLARFKREARVLAALSHPNIVKIHEFAAENQIYYAVTELLNGETLADRIAGAPLPLKEALEIALAIAAGLAGAHSKGIVHRDIKPLNIYLTSNGKVKILDFGLARAVTLDQSQKNSAQTTLVESKPGLMMGTLPYMSPEQVRGGVVDARSDIFSFGSVLYEMVTGCRPFSFSESAETIAAILRDTPPLLLTPNDQIPPELRTLLLNCLAKNRGERAENIAVVIESLTSISSSLLTPQQISPSVAISPAEVSPSQKASKAARKSSARTGSRRESTRKPAGYQAIAVLPFSEARLGIGMDYLGEGISEAIISMISPLVKLRVMAYSAVARYRNSELELDKIRRELKVDLVLTGRVTAHGNIFLIQTELIDTRDGSQLWGERYKMAFADIFEVQEDIARQITEHLQLKLNGAEREKLTEKQTDNPAAYNAYLKGRYFWNKRSEEGFNKAIESFQQAIALDANYALAYAGIADCYILSSHFSISPHEAAARAKAMIDKALKLDGRLAEAHTSLAFIKMTFDWDFAGAERGFECAIALNPNYATAHNWFAMYLMGRGRFEQALNELQLALALDPLSLTINMTMGLLYYFEQRYQETIEHIFRVLEMEKSFIPAYHLLGDAYVLKGDYPQAIAAYQQCLTLSGDETDIVMLGYGYAMAGRREEARAILERLEHLPNRELIPPSFIARIYLGLDDRQAALAWLARAFQVKDFWLFYLRVDPVLDNLRREPKFNELMSQLG